MAKKPSLKPEALRPLTDEQCLDILEPLDAAASTLNRLISKLEGRPSVSRTFVQAQIRILKAWVADAEDACDTP